MIKYTEEFFKKSFTDDSMKKAYLKACKWYSTNVLANVEMKDVLVDFKKSDNYLPTIVMHLSIGLNEKDIRDRHCEICKQSHSHFFCSEETNCAWCKVKGYQNRTDESIKTKIAYYKSKLEID